MTTTSRPSDTGEDLVVVRNLVKVFASGGTSRRAVDDVSFTLRRGRTLGLVGESGSGKSTTGLCVLRLQDVTSGTIEFDGTDITTSHGAELRRLRRRMQMVFQDPYASLNPRMSAIDSVVEPLVIHDVGESDDQKRRAAELLDLVGIPARDHRKRPRNFSGGQRQRIGIARSLALRPDFIVCDEPVSALDVSIQAQILNLLKDLQDEFGLTYLFISHDLGVVRTMCDDILVMSNGQVVESGPTETILGHPAHDYTKTLIAAVPNASPAPPA